MSVRNAAAGICVSARVRRLSCRFHAARTRAGSPRVKCRPPRARSCNGRFTSSPRLPGLLPRGGEKGLQTAPSPPPVAWRLMRPRYKCRRRSSDGSHHPGESPVRPAARRRSRHPSRGGTTRPARQTPRAPGPPPRPAVISALEPRPASMTSTPSDSPLMMRRAGVRRGTRHRQLPHHRPAAVQQSARTTRGCRAGRCGPTHS